eukprot:5200878-Pleurochrysis_carterae.AAC.6
MSLNSTKHAPYQTSFTKRSIRIPLRSSQGSRLPYLTEVTSLSPRNPHFSVADRRRLKDKTHSRGSISGPPLLVAQALAPPTPPAWRSVASWSACSCGCPTWPPRSCLRCSCHSYAGMTKFGVAASEWEAAEVAPSRFAAAVQ